MDGRDTASECRARSGAEHACFKFTETITTSVSSLQKHQLTLELNPRIDSKEGPSAKAAKLFQTLIEELQELKTAVVEVREEVRRSEEARVVFEARMAEEHGCSCAHRSDSVVTAQRGESTEDHKDGCLPA